MKKPWKASIEEVFRTEKGDCGTIDPRRKKCIEFRKTDILQQKYPEDMDFLLERDVLIYFTEEAKEQL